LDEPTNGLDPAGRRAMLDLIRSLHRDFGKSVILSSHLLDDVARVCDSIVIIDGGRVLAHGRIDVLKAHLRGRYRLRLEGDAAPFIARLREAGVSVREEPVLGSSETELVADVPPGFRPRRFFEVLAELDGARRATSAAGGGGPVLRGLVPDEERLEDVFRRVVAAGAPREVGLAG
ncbi:MAG: hypothetical protein HY721_10255, partial [Planctomycetes bacterium]|nr:hypothetical protein [Planctomycetota bacterium]